MTLIAPRHRFDPTCPACCRPRPATVAAAGTIAGLVPTFDRDAGANRARRRAFERSMRMEQEYGAKLRAIARHIGTIINGFEVKDLPGATWLRTALERYAAALQPWAEAVAKTTVTEIAARDERSWFQVASRMGRELREELAAAPTGPTLRSLMNDQVTLIKSLPLEAAERVHRLAIEGIETGSRASSLADEIMRTGEVTRSRANLIARTEVGRVSTVLTQVRAQHIGSDGYVWKTIGDSDVRPSHRAMNNKFVRWTDPPTLDNLTGHAGALPNCRCYCEPVLPDL